MVCASFMRPADSFDRHGGSRSTCNHANRLTRVLTPDERMLRASEPNRGRCRPRRGDFVGGRPARLQAGDWGQPVSSATTHRAGRARLAARGGLWSASSAVGAAARRRGSRSLAFRGGAEGGRHGRGEPFPACRLFLQLLLSGEGQPVVLGTAAAFALAPFRLDEPLALESLERWVERALPASVAQAGRLARSA